MNIIYLTSVYPEPDSERQAELNTCILNVIEMDQVDKIYLLKEGNTNISAFKHKKVKYFEMPNRPTFNDFFECANSIAKKGDIIIIANTDIYPEYGTRELIKNIGDNESYALSRWDESTQGEKVHVNRRDTADAWIFKAPIREIEANFFLGIAGCDNAIAHRVHQSGYKVSNPSKTIKFNHLHNSGVRSYNPNTKVDKPYLLISPHELGENFVHDFIL